MPPSSSLSLGIPPKAKRPTHRRRHHALCWLSDNLARSAYDGGGAPSPAKDAGSLDFLNGGTTSTDGSLSAIVADNAPSDHGDLGDPDNMDANGDLVAVDWTDSDHRLDMGYHYGASAQADGASTLYTTLRYPKERVDVSWTGVTPSVTKPYHLALAAGKDASGDPVTVSVFTTDDQDSIGYQVFRGGSLLTGVIDTNTGFNVISTRAVAAAASPSGTVYAGTIGWSEPAAIYGGQIIYYQKRLLQVYRLAPDGSWVPIGEYQVTADFSNLNLPQYARIALAPSGNNLYVFWQDQDPREAPHDTPQLRGGYIANAAGTGSVADLGGSSNPITDLHLGQLTVDPEEFLDLQAEWDDGQAVPRIVYVDDWENGASDGTPELHAARVTLSGNDPVGLDSTNNWVVSTYGKTASLAMRRSDFSINSTSNRAFCSLLNTSSPAVQSYGLDDSGTPETWPHAGTDIPSAEEPAVTSRPFGTERLFYVEDSTLVDDLLGVFDQATQSVSWPKLDSWKLKPENVFLLNRGTSADTLDVYQILP